MAWGKKPLPFCGRGQHWVDDGERRPEGKLLGGKGGGFFPLPGLSRSSCQGSGTPPSTVTIFLALVGPCLLATVMYSDTSDCLSLPPALPNP